MECPICNKNYSNIIGHLKNQGYTVEEAEMMITRGRNEEDEEDE